MTRAFTRVPHVAGRVYERKRQLCCVQAACSAIQSLQAILPTLILLLTRWSLAPACVCRIPIAWSDEFRNDSNRHSATSREETHGTDGTGRDSGSCTIRELNAERRAKLTAKSLGAASLDSLHPTHLWLFG